MSVNRNKIVKFCNDYLKVKDVSDHCHNGLQIEGALEVDRIVTGVSLSKKLIEAAIQEKAQMIIVHHGLFKSNLAGLQIKGALKGRLKQLLNNDLNLLGYHLPLDLHPKIGNNISICKELGLDDCKTLNLGTYGDLGFMGELKKEMPIDEFVDLVNSKLETKSYTLLNGSEKVKKVAVVSGGAAPEYQYAVEAGCDTYICGDIREEVVREVEEIGINFINAGHYNTEKLGIQNLGEVVAKEFDIEVKFIDIPNEI